MPSPAPTPDPPAPARRRLLGTGVAAALAAFLGTPEDAFATVGDVEREIARFGDGAVPSPGGIAIGLPEIAENGRSVPVSIDVDSPMTADDHVTAVLLLAPENPNTRVATFRFTPASGTASVATRMRLERSQSVVAIARLSDGTLRSARREIGVTIGGCSA